MQTFAQNPRHRQRAFASDSNRQRLAGTVDILQTLTPWRSTRLRDARSETNLQRELSSGEPLLTFEDMRRTVYRRITYHSADDVLMLLTRLSLTTDGESGTASRVSAAVLADSVDFGTLMNHA